jgi:two-component system sensor histidine kinase AlgZ
MHPVLSSLRALSSYLLAWLVGGGVFAWALIASAQTPWRNALWFAVPVCLVYAFVIPSAYYVCRALPFTRRRLSVGAGLFATASAIAGAVGWGLCLGWNRLSVAMESDWAGIVVAPGTGLVFFTVGAGIYLCSLLLHDVMMALDQMRNAQQRELQSRSLAHEAELQMLRMQINPHFMFNCLNSISALTSMDAVAARGMTIALAQYFRQTLSLSEQASIPLAQELAHCQCFLDIEAMRFGSKLAVDIAVDDAAQTAQVPPMLLQPLVENAVKHGIACNSRPGTVHISGAVRGAWLQLSVDNPREDDGYQDTQSAQTAAPAASSNVAGLGLGLGLRNIRQRLHALYGDQARITQRVADHRFVVELTLPFTPTPTHGVRSS